MGIRRVTANQLAPLPKLTGLGWLGLPAAGQQLGNSRDVHRWEEAQRVSQILLRVDPTAAATEHEGVDDRAAPGDVRVRNK